MKQATIVEIISVLFMILFLYTGVSKLMDYAVFKEQIATSPVLAPFARPIAFALPWAEFFVTLLLIVPRWKLRGLYASLALMMIFTFYIILILLFNDRLPCNCGGVIELLSWKQHLVFNAFFMMLSALGIRMSKKMKKEDKLQVESLQY